MFEDFYGFSQTPFSRSIPTDMLYHGNDSDFTTALSNYYALRDEARFGGYQGYLQRSDDFIRFCCRMHITEMLSARGGAGEAKTVWRWPNRF